MFNIKGLIGKVTSGVAPKEPRPVSATPKKLVLGAQAMKALSTPRLRLK